MEVYRKDAKDLKKILNKEGITFTEDKFSNKRPLVWIIQKEDFKVERKEDLPVMPLKELIGWGKELHLENILEQLDVLYDLNLKVKYFEVLTNG